MRGPAVAHVALFGSLLFASEPARAQAPLRPTDAPSPQPPPAEVSPAPTTPPVKEPASDPTAAPPPAAELPASPPPEAVTPAQEPAPMVAQPTQASPGPPDQPDRDLGSVRRPSKFYSSLGIGGGYFHASSGASNDTRRFSGSALAVQLVLGGRAGKTRTVTVGGAYLRDQVFGLTAEDEVVDGDEPSLDDVTFALWLLGFFADVAVNSAPGLHFQGVAGFSGLEVSAPDRDTDNPFGLALNLGVGYDFQVGQHLALGALLRGTFAPLSVDENNGTDVAALAPSLLLTATTR